MNQSPNTINKQEQQLFFESACIFSFYELRLYLCVFDVGDLLMMFVEYFSFSLSFIIFAPSSACEYVCVYHAWIRYCFCFIDADIQTWM